MIVSRSAGDLERPGQELPRPVDRLALEVIAEAEIPQHLEERLVERGLADVLDVAGAQAFLARVGTLEVGSPSPMNSRLNWFMPAGVKSTVGSLGTSTSLARRTQPLETKKSRNASRSSSVFMYLSLTGVP